MRFVCDILEATDVPTPAKYNYARASHLEAIFRATSEHRCHLPSSSCLARLAYSCGLVSELMIISICRIDRRAVILQGD